jgi:ssDNA-binding Zn-finger/Zn-ribbon topoisomerase 1
MDPDGKKSIRRGQVEEVDLAPVENGPIFAGGDVSRDRQTVGTCPKCKQGAVVCTYNHFAGPDERIDSWEHRCAECGYRDTQAFRSSDDTVSDGANGGLCPFCQRQGVK